MIFHKTQPIHAKGGKIMHRLKVVLVGITMILGSSPALGQEISFQFTRHDDSGHYQWLLQTDFPICAIFFDADDAVHLKSYSTPNNTWTINASWEEVSLYQQFYIPAPSTGRWLYYYAPSPSEAIGPGQMTFSLATSANFSPGLLKGLIVYQDGSIANQQILGPSQIVSEPGGIFLMIAASFFAYFVFFRRKSLAK